MNTLKVITYNTWHGLNGKGTFEFGRLEPKGRHELRQKWQLQEFKKMDADLLFLQEVCPLTETSEHLARVLQMDQVHQLDQSGMKIAGRGLPRNLSTGLTILAKRRFELKKLAALKLSGGRGALFDWGSFQFSEFRYALLAEIQLPEGQALLVNTHLHHAPVISDQDLDQLRELSKGDRIKSWQREGFLKSIQKGHERRLNEARKLLDYIRAVRGKYQVVILCGDLNEHIHSSLLQEFKDDGFQDSVPEHQAEDSNLYTWNHLRNETNHSYTQHLNPPVSCYGNSYLVELFRDMDRKPRRIDYTLIQGNAKVDSVKLAFDEPRAIGDKGAPLIGSDHFGLLTVLSV